jgi:hypothetical protein
MNNPGKLISKLTACFQILAISFLAACTLSTQQLSVCHATGSPAKPYEEITATQAQLKEYATHPNDYLYPVPANGCPTNALVVSAGMITICHATGSNTSPYDEIKVSVNGLNGHGTHTNDIIPAPAGGCPTSALAIQNGKVTLCHATGSQTNPYNEITVSVNGLNGHSNHPDDIIPAPSSSCPSTLAIVSNGKITICHATGSQNNPYVEITVSVNGLNGHSKHSGDILPAPAGGCPTTKP